MITKSRQLYSKLSKCIHIQRSRRFCSQADQVADLHRAALTGDTEMLNQLLAEDTHLINMTNKQGRTAIMEAARGGQAEMVKALLSYGADVSHQCKSGHTALDFALFWQRMDCYNILSASNPDSEASNKEMFFCSTKSIDRASKLREDEDALLDKLKDSAPKFLLMHKLSPIAHSNSRGTRANIAWINLSDLTRLLNISDVSELTSKAILLGVRKASTGTSKPRDTTDHQTLPDESALFAIDVSAVDVDRVESVIHGAKVLPGVMGMLMMNQEDGALCAQACSLIDWHRKNKYCSVCGSLSRPVMAGSKRICENAACLTQKGIHNTSHPRVDPTVITLILNTEQDACVLARGRHFPPGMYSCVAGFVEPGEGVEQACRREVEEEVGLFLDQVTYFNSQPWPSPSALVIGCVAQVSSTKLTVDKDELEDARWFKRQEAVEMITRSHPDRLFIPPRQAIAHHLIKAWLKRTVLF